MNWPIRCVIHDLRQRTSTLALAVVFCLQALMPAGYMPGSQGSAQGVSLSLCVSGLSAAAIRALDLGDDGSSSDHITPYCALTSVSGPDGPPIASIVYLSMALFSGVTLPAAKALSVPLWLLRGPPLGPRAPPVYR